MTRMVCPSCKRMIEREPNPHRPFCSPRCRMADLGNWLSGGYRIVSSAAEEELDQGPSSEGEPTPQPN